MDKTHAFWKEQGQSLTLYDLGHVTSLGLVPGEAPPALPGPSTYRLPALGVLIPGGGGLILSQYHKNGSQFRRTGVTRLVGARRQGAGPVTPPGLGPWPGWTWSLREGGGPGTVRLHESV